MTTASTAVRTALVWLLLFAIAVLGLTTTTQQALGSMHRHADQSPHPTFELSAAVASVASDWVARRQQQEVAGHGQLRLDTGAYALRWLANHTRMVRLVQQPQDHHHAHDAFERHHHAPDGANLVSLDGAAEGVSAADGSGSAASVVLPLVGSPSRVMALPGLAGTRGPWPVVDGALFASRSVAPPLRPPAV